MNKFASICLALLFVMTQIFFIKLISGSILCPILMGDIVQCI